MTNMYWSVMLVGLGSGLGAYLRTEISSWFGNWELDFPLGTMLINIVGSFLLGIFTVKTSNNWLLFLGTGFCGGFTTFSTFNLEATDLWFQKKFYRWTIYLILTYILGIFAFIMGYKV
ncbi:fluoride efflux transporter CrcB [Companilactobacillus metriopterae]|uniref:fluoride efflux transporter CrcB n=1 Tax=Companilactobacillus metriopterae TaxID=1909267 RepID=UPI001F50B5D2|nr:fluoride efflux transporter CrcB [Companilactobacillus metriopterae]